MKKFSLSVWLFCCAFLAISLLARTDTAFADKQIVLTGKLTTTVTRAPNTNFHGIVEEVLVSPGMHVKEGDPILKYSLQDDARRALQRELNNGPGIEGMQGQILNLERDLANIQAQRNRARSLAAKGLGSAQSSGRLDADVQSMTHRIELIRSSMAKAQANFNVRMKELSGYFNETITASSVLPHYLYVRSPIDGYVLNVDMWVKPGATIPAGAAPIRVGQMDPMIIQVPIYERDLASVRVGDTASVEIPSLGEKKFTACVKEIAWVANDMNVSQASYYNVQLSIPNGRLELKPGFKAVVRIEKR